MRLGELLWWSNGEDSELSLLGVWVQSLDEELISHMLCSMDKKYLKKNQTTVGVESNLESFNPTLKLDTKVCSLPVYGSLQEYFQRPSLKVLKFIAASPLLLESFPLGELKSAFLQPPPLITVPFSKTSWNKLFFKMIKKGVHAHCNN